MPADKGCRVGDGVLQVSGRLHQGPAVLILLAHPDCHSAILVDAIAVDPLCLALPLHLLKQLGPGARQLEVDEDIDVVGEVVARLLVPASEHSSR